MGGIGNQLFQYAFGKALKHPTAYETAFYDRTDNHHPRQYHLDKFNTSIKKSPFLAQDTFQERLTTGLQLGLLELKDHNFDGYWQYKDYYEPILDDLRKDFTIKWDYYTEKFLRLRGHITSCQSVSIHIRRGDYLKQKGFYNLETNYYIQALAHLAQGEVIFVFSDDIPWCMEKFKSDIYDREVVFVHIEDYLEFELMKLCKYNIIANSTFSWWAAFLNDYPDKVVICPSGWISGARETNNEEGKKIADQIYYPQNWIKL
jgi:hypothetical protein